MIAEAGVNHNGRLDLAKRLIDAAADAAANAVKFQTFKAERLTSAKAPKAEYQKKSTNPKESQLDMLRRLELSPKDYQELVKHCRKKKILFLSTPFDEESADMLERLGISAFKISSGEITNLPLLCHVAEKGLPIILSTGMSYLEEVREAVEAVRKTRRDIPLILLHCVSSYPAPAGEMNLRAMDTLRREFEVPVGFSDHSSGIEIALAAVACGAALIEKHFTLDRKMDGPDHRASLEPAELKSMVEGIKKVSSALGDGAKKPQPCEENVRRVARKSLVAARDIPAGSSIGADMIAIRRPGTGLAPKELTSVVGKKAKAFILQDRVITKDLLS